MVPVILLIVLGALVYGGYGKYQKGIRFTSDSEKWTTYEVSSYRFSFDYPKNSIVDAQQDTSGRFLRVQNYNAQDISRSMSGKYWVEFFVFTKNNESSPSSCPRNIVDYDITHIDGVAIYKGITKPDEGSGVGGGYTAMCIERQDYDLYIQGQDDTAENILDQILKTIRF